MSTADVFIVDDNPDNLHLLAGILRAHDYRVRMATGGPFALEAIGVAPPELIMLDIQMPEMNGYDVCRRLKDDPTTCDIPVIFISALDDVLDKVKAFKTGGVDYVTKPFQSEEVIARVENQLEISRLRRALEERQEDLESRNAELVRKNRELLQSRRRTGIVFSALVESLPGTTLDGRYRLEERIGSGGFGAVYRAMHLGLNRHVAVKVFHPSPGNETAAELERFKREGVSACRVNHPNAVTVVDSGCTTTGIAYLVMELLNGPTLRQVIQEQGTLEVSRCAEIMGPVCDVLAEAHASGVVHRDVKPNNILLHRTSSGEVVKVVDFGIAKLTAETTEGDASTLTRAGELVGTPVYMAPERLLGRACDGSADVYSAGVILYEMVSGSMPFQMKEPNAHAMAMMCLTREPRPLRDIDPAIPLSVERIIMRSLAKDAGERPTASELAVELRAAASLEPGFRSLGARRPSVGGPEDTASDIPTLASDVSEE